MTERARLVLEWERRWKRGEGLVNISELCREFGVSRECGYKWIRRYEDAGRKIAAIAEKSRRPRNTPTIISDATADVIVIARKQYPRWGPRKLRAVLMEKNPGVPVPSASAIAAVLKRRGMVFTKRGRRRATVNSEVKLPFDSCAAPNAVWCVDFKGWFRTTDGKKCYPLTLTDAYSRYVLRCEALIDPDVDAVWRVFDSAFSEFGIPAGIRSDNGPPFATTGAAGLSELSVWWLEMGVRVERIAPGNPQQNGRHERMHRTLKGDVPPKANLRRQQAAFDEWRREFNDERPHEALGMKPPTKFYVASSKRYPRAFRPLQFFVWDNTVKADKSGAIRFARQTLHISSVLRHQTLQLERTDARGWKVTWGAVHVGRIADTRGDLRFIPARTPRGEVTVLSLFSDDE